MDLHDCFSFLPQKKKKNQNFPISNEQSVVDFPGQSMSSKTANKTVFKYCYAYRWYEYWIPNSIFYAYAKLLDTAYN